MIKIREFKEEDKNFILSSFLKNYYSSMPGFKPESEVFFPNHQKQLEKLYSNGDIVVVVACLDDDEDLIIGYAIFGLDKTLHYVLVKESYKKMGMATRLIRHVIKDRKELVVSHYVPNCQILKRKFKLIYNPYKFFS